MANLPSYMSTRYIYINAVLDVSGKPRSDTLEIYELDINKNKTILYTHTDEFAPNPITLNLRDNEKNVFILQDDGDLGHWISPKIPKATGQDVDVTFAYQTSENGPSHAIPNIKVKFDGYTTNTTYKGFGLSYTNTKHSYLDAYRNNS